MNNGDVWSVWIDYDGTSLHVALADDSTNRPKNLIDYPIDIPSLLGASWDYVGFTAGTGAGDENHYVMNFQRGSRNHASGGVMTLINQTCHNQKSALSPAQHRYRYLADNAATWTSLALDVLGKAGRDASSSFAPASNPSPQRPGKEGQPRIAACGALDG